MGAAVVFAVAALALTAATTVMSVVTQAQEGKFQAKVARRNAVLAQQGADDAIARGRVEEAVHRRSIAQTIGIQRAALAGAGVEVDTGSALDLTSDAAATGEFEALTIRANAEREAYSFRTSGVAHETEAKAARARARNQALGTALSGASQLASRFSTFSSEGGPLNNRVESRNFVEQREKV